MHTHIARLGPYNTLPLLTFLDALYRDTIPENERDEPDENLKMYIVD